MSELETAQKELQTKQFLYEQAQAEVDELRHRRIILFFALEAEQKMRCEKEKQIAEANKIIDEPNTRPIHKWIINNLDKSEQIEFAFRKLEKRIERLHRCLANQESEKK